MQTYIPIRFNYNKITCTSSITILLKVPHIPEEEVTIIKKVHKAPQPNKCLFIEE